MITFQTLKARTDLKTYIGIWFPAQETTATDSYVSAVQAEILRPAGQGLFSLNRKDLLERQATLFALFTNRHGHRELVAGLHAVVDGDSTQWLQGAIVQPEFRGRGLMKPLAGIARLVGALGGARTTSCVVRVYPNGTANTPSLLSFTAVGLRQRPEEGRAKLKGDRHDLHLFATAEPDATVRYLTLTGDVRTLAPAQAEIDRWSERS